MTKQFSSGVADDPHSTGAAIEAEFGGSRGGTQEKAAEKTRGTGGAFTGED